MRFLFIILVICGIFCIGFSEKADANWWKYDGQVKTLLALSDKQVAEMDSLMTAYMEKRIEHKAEIGKLKIKLNSLLSKEKLDRQEVDKAVNRLSEVRRNMMIDMLAMKLNVRKVLTKEQVKKILAHDPSIFTLQKQWSKEKRKKRSRKGRVINKMKSHKMKNKSKKAIEEKKSKP